MAVPHYMGLNEFVETLSQYLTQRKLRRHYRSHERLLDDVESIVQEFMKERLGPLNLDFAVWRGVAELGTEGIDPVPVFGTDFIPDMVVSVSDSPTLAIHAQLIRGRLSTSDKIGAAIGRALVYSQKYPAVLTLVHHTGGSAGYKHLLDREVLMDLWNSHKIKLLFH